MKILFTTSVALANNATAEMLLGVFITRLAAVFTFPGYRFKICNEMDKSKEGSFSNKDLNCHREDTVMACMCWLSNLLALKGWLSR